MVDREFLKQIHLFYSLNDHDLATIYRILHRLDVPAGTVLIQENEPGDRFYMVREGQVQIIKALNTTAERLLTVVNTGGYFGEMSLLNPDGLRAASARTSMPSVVYEMHYEDFGALLDTHPALALEITRNLSLRLRENDNATIRDLTHANQELTQAYDMTLEGWAKALELRDSGTGGHTHRVTEMTVKLAAHLGIFGDTLIHIRRGAMLHDIGKMGIPDNILLKPGKLDDDEWVIMRRHPQYAVDMLWPIEFLRPSLDIPFCHHEKWDGTGYPRGLRGEEIPLSARIFALVDVWDALTSDRPYRKAMPMPEVLAHLRQQSGTHFDPEMVKVFVDYFKDQLESDEKNSCTQSP